MAPPSVAPNIRVLSQGRAPWRTTSALSTSTRTLVASIFSQPSSSVGLGSCFASFLSPLVGASNPEVLVARPCRKDSIPVCPFHWQGLSECGRSGGLTSAPAKSGRRLLRCCNANFVFSMDFSWSRSDALWALLRVACSCFTFTFIVVLQYAAQPVPVSRQLRQFGFCTLRG